MCFLNEGVADVRRRCCHESSLEASQRLIRVVTLTAFFSLMSFCICKSLLMRQIKIQVKFVVLIG